MRLIPLLFLITVITKAENYNFDINDIEKKPYSLNGYLELQPGFTFLNNNSTQYKLENYQNEKETLSLDYNINFQLEGRYEKRIIEVYGRPALAVLKGPYTETTTHFDFQEIYALFKYTILISISELNSKIG